MNTNVNSNEQTVTANINDVVEAARKEGFTEAQIGELVNMAEEQAVKEVSKTNDQKWAEFKMGVMLIGRSTKDAAVQGAKATKPLAKKGVGKTAVGAGKTMQVTGKGMQVAGAYIEKKGEQLEKWGVLFQGNVKVTEQDMADVLGVALPETK